MTLQQEMKQERIIRELNQFIRKQPDEVGAQKLQKYSKNSDLSYAQTLINAAKRYFGQALKQWSKYEQKIQDHLTNFMNNIHTKIYYSKLTHLQYLFKPLKDLYKKITKREVVLLSEETLLEESDRVVQKYVKQKESQIQKTLLERGYNLLSDTEQKQDKSKQQHVLIPLKMIGNKLESSRAEVWKETFFKVNLFYSPFFRIFSNLDDKLFDISKQQTNKQFVDNYLQTQKILKNTLQWKQIQNSEQPRINYRECACCLSYVYEDQDLSFPTFSQQVAFLSNIHLYGAMQQEIKGQIVSFLNGKGGVIFLGCKLTKDGRVVPCLDVTLQSSKSQAQDKFRSYIEDIYPSVQLKRHIDLSFIPVAQSVANSTKRQLKWLPGVYLLRIIVNPVEPHNTYHYKYNDLIHFAKQSQKRIVYIQKQEIYQFMKKKYIQYNVKMIGGLRERGNLVPTVVKHNGTCRGVEKGIPEYGTHTQYDKLQNMIQGKISNPLLTDRSTYKSVSLLVVDNGVVADIKKIFNQKQKLQAVIDTAFPQKKFRLSNNTWLVWHNVKFQKLMAGLKKEMNSLKQKNSRKPPLLISTCPCVKSMDANLLSKQIVEDVKQFAQKESKQKVEHKVILDYDFFKTTSTITAVLIYYYLNHKYQIKSVFQKTPTGSEMKHKHVKDNESRLPAAYQKQKTAKSIRQPDHNAPQQQNDYLENNNGNHEDSQQYVQQHSPRKTQKAELHIKKKTQSRQNRNGYEQMPHQQVQANQYPIVIFSRYDQHYNVWQFCDNGILYFYNSSNVYVGSRVYERQELQYYQMLEQQQMQVQQHQHQYYN